MCVRLSPIKAEKKRKDGTPSPSSPKMVIDLTTEEEYATFLLTQLSEKELSELTQPRRGGGGWAVPCHGAAT